MTGSEGSKHTRRMLRAGTKVVGGVTPGKGGQKVEFDAGPAAGGSDGSAGIGGSDSVGGSGGTVLPVFNSVAEAMAETGADVTVVFVPPRFAKSAVIEAIDAGIPLCVVITEGIPVHDTTECWAYAQGRGTRIKIGRASCRERG